MEDSLTLANQLGVSHHLNLYTKPISKLPTMITTHCKSSAHQRGCVFIQRDRLTGQ